MNTQPIRDRWIHLRWCHYYQWKNLLVDEREARRQLEQVHQQQMRQLRPLDNGREAAALMYEQLAGLTHLRMQLHQKRLALRAIQDRQMNDIRQELGQEGIQPPVDSFDSLSALRRP